MHPLTTSLVRTIAYLTASLLPLAASAQTITFEELPDGSPTLDQQLVCGQYAELGVRFELVDRTSGEPIGCPRIARFGPPQNAFEGCFSDDTPRPGQSTGSALLTDGTSLGIEGDLLVRYDPPVSYASGVVLDVDCRVNGGPPCEQWTITARSASGATLATRVIDAPPGAPNPECASPAAGPGDSIPFGWSFDLPGQAIASILFRYTGAATDVGLAFDDFSPSSASGIPAVTLRGPRQAVCAGGAAELLAEVRGGAPPYAYRWQQESAPGVWDDLGAAASQLVRPAATTRYRVVVTDDDGILVTSDPLTQTVVSGAGQAACDVRLLVSSSVSDRILRYNPVDMSFVDTFVSAGGGGLDTPSGLAFGRDGNLYVSSQANDRVLRFGGSSGAFIDTFVAAGSGGLDVPTDLEFGPDGRLYVASAGNDRVLRYDGTTGAFVDTFIAAASGGLDRPANLQFQDDGTLLISSLDDDAVKRYDASTGAYLGDCVPAGSGALAAPRGLANGPDGRLYVGEEVGDRVKAYLPSCGPPAGEFVSAGSGTLDRANDHLFGYDDNLYVASYNNDKVLRFGGQSGAFIDAFPTGNGLDGPAFLRLSLFCGDARCDGVLAESSCSCPSDCGAPPAVESSCGNGLDDDCDLGADCADSDCATSAICAGAGATPDGAAFPGTMLTLARDGTRIDLAWGPSCRASDIDYAVYEGLLGAPTSHAPVTCSTAGAPSWTLAPASGARFYLIVPHNGVYEGSAGLRSDGSERPPGVFACRERRLAGCP